MEPTVLQVVWFVLFGVLLIGYAILDGFDLGVGVLGLFRKRSHDRRIMVNAIAPIWDGNEVWLLTAGGALFAAFPPVYATVFSGFYLAFMLLLLFLILRAVSMEFRSQVDSPGWTKFWDVIFGIGSLVPAILYGVAIGNILRGIPLDAAHSFTGTFLGLLNPYAILLGVLSLVMFVAHGAIYMTMKAEGDLETAMRAWATRSWMAWVVVWVVATLATFFVSPWLFEGLLSNPLFWVAFLGLLASFTVIPLALKDGRPGRAFVASSVAIATTLGLVGLSLFPRLVPSITNLDYSLTITNASSTPRALTTMLVIAAIGVPIVLVYTIVIYRVFKGKVKLGEHSY